MTEETWQLLIICVTVIFIVAFVTNCIKGCIKSRNEQHRYLDSISNIPVPTKGINEAWNSQTVTREERR